MINSKSLNLLLQWATLVVLLGLMVNSEKRNRCKSKSEFTQHNSYILTFFLKNNRKMGKVGYPQQLQKWCTSLQLVSLYTSGFFLIFCHRGVNGLSLPSPWRRCIALFPTPNPTPLVGASWLDPSAHWHPPFSVLPQRMCSWHWTQVPHTTHCGWTCEPKKSHLVCT